MTKQDFFDKAYPAAVAAGHLFPDYAVCEAALESAWGGSKLAIMANNLFGQKDGEEDYPNIELPTREFLNGQWVTVKVVKWPAFPDWKTAFAERMALLHRNPAYQKALAAENGEKFIREVSKVWATDPSRAEKVLLTYRCNVARINAAKGER